jgi:NitT/TauT family transport system ATP-binding protein
MNVHAMAGTERIVARGVTKRFGSLAAIENVSLSITEGRFVTVVGPSGCGKSTMLRMLGGLVPATEGCIVIDGEAVTGPKPDKIGFVFQEPLLLPWKTAAENVEFPLSLRGVPAVERRERAEALLNLVGLSHSSNLFPSQLSGGMKQRVAIARGMVNNPRILLMDEPFAALDELTRTQMWEELLRIWERSRSTILFITHGLAEAIYLADYVLVMGTRPGRILEKIAVDLPRPRTMDMLGAPELGRIRNHIWHLIAGPK